MQHESIMDEDLQQEERAKSLRIATKTTGDGAMLKRKGILNNKKK